MPVRWAIASGNWSNSAIWNGGLGLPTASDDVAANGFTVTIDQNINVLQLRTLVTGSAASGGGFVINDNYTITANINAGTTNCLTFNSGSAGFTINGDIDTINAGTNIATLIINGTGTITINGNLKRTTTGSGRSLITINSISTININGNVTPAASAVTANTIVANTAGTTINITGPISILPVNNIPVITLNSLAGTININGNISTNYTTNPIINLPGVGSIITVTGSVTTNGTTGGQLISTNQPIQIYITGSLRAGTASTLNLSGNSTVIVQGPISSSISASGVISTSAGATNIFTGPFYNTGSWNAVYANNMQIINNVTSSWTVDLSNGTQKTLVTANQLAGYPTTNNVRHGIPYGPGNEFTGSLAMPDPSTVKTGVATDNTTGSAILTSQDLFDIETQTLTTSGSIGTLLTGASTVQTVGATIASFKV